MPAPEPAGRIILATNVAETSLTIPGVCAVVDSGLERRVRFHPRTGMDHWETTEISEASATQRQGRAGRLGPGVCLRWWHPSVPRRPFSTPEILEADLAPLLLETALWGAASPDDLTWITPPPAGALHQAAELLRKLDLLDTAGRITATGRKVAGMGLHPRLGRMILTAAQRGWLATAAITAAILAEGDPLGGGDPDFRDRLKAWAEWAKGKPGGLRPETARRIGAEARRIIRAAGAGGSVPGGGDIDAALAGRLLLLAYPDRAAQRVGGGLPGEAARLVLATGRGATVNGPLAQEEFLAIAELDGSEKTAHLFLAAPVLRTEIEDGLAGQTQTVVRYAWEGWSLRCLLETRVGGLVLGRKGGTAPDPADVLKAVGERLAQEGIDALPWSDRTRRFAARCRFVGRCGVPPPHWPDFAPATLLAEVKEWLFPFLDCRGTGTVINADLLLQALEGRLGRRYLHRLDELAPETWELPSGTRKRLDYETGEVPVLAARLQEFFGCRRTPCLCGQPLLLHLLSPAGRPVQVTGDLDGFWDRGYPEVKKELHGRYPRHHWPGDPRAVPPTARAKKRK
jgi:ATP-dependent helicase HrpB